MRNTLRRPTGEAAVQDVGGTSGPVDGLMQCIPEGELNCSREEEDGDEIQTVWMNDRPQEGGQTVAGRVCVGGAGQWGTLEAEVVGMKLWRRTLGTEELYGVSGCHRHPRVVYPDLMMNLRWSVEGNASLLSYVLDHLCTSVPRVVVVQPAGIYARYVTMCQALGGALVSDGNLSSTTTELARGANDSCVGAGGLVTWLGGGYRVAGTELKVNTEDECPAMGVSGPVWASCELRMECSVCEVPDAILFNLYGHDGKLFDHSFYIDTDSGALVFRGLGGSAIMREGGGWVLRSTLHQTEWLLRDAAVPVGRQRWSVEGQEVVLALTTCRTTQFACDDGQCVPHTSRCDDIVHCGDSSDEANCQVVERPLGYDPYYAPPPRPGEVVPIDLDYHIDVYNVGDVTTNVGEASMDVGITIAWFDPRVKFLNLKPEIKNYFPCELVWTPRVRGVSGRGEGNILDTNDYEKFCYSYQNDQTEERPLHDPLMGHQADGMTHAIEVYLGVLATVPCHFQLQMYPFDVQMCNLSFMVMNAPSTRVFHKSTPGNHVPYLNARRVLLEYSLEDQTTEVGWYMLGSDNNTFFSLTYHLRRLYGYHVMNSFFPSLLIFFISYVTFFFQLEDFTNRIMISLTGQLVLAALFTSTTQSSVKTPYLKLIDVWYAAIITFCFLIIISQTLINVVLHSVRLPSAIIKVREFGARQSNKVKPLFSKRPESQQKHSHHHHHQHQEKPNQEMARFCNLVAQVVLLTLVVIFIFFYVLMAAGLLPNPATSTSGAER
ncbi:uncharacterized protein LOC121853174 [Homarus americanus]|uniref:uncharacterized protein LOC121853174 n=1 Tax=Homarus americanus TaxID=6706 RepID=UPI001C44F05C|nr:uncharacterized protein LOC121853174 [Homarus americanus]